ncbi:glycosyl hydrolase family 18 protein [Poriferisphaera sp. WC338]|uniref:glycosyl hydrolase family 18 protein n=1 Tax=Poriferisphaera sp. WC338 TaxID=3425129 RepID=UPI003D819B32
MVVNIAGTQYVFAADEPETKLKLGRVKTIQALEAADFRIYGYMPGYVVKDWGKVDPRYLSDVVYFAGNVKKDGTLVYSEKEIQKLPMIVKSGRRYKFKVHFAIGGWAQSDRYVPVMSSDRLQQKLIVEIVKFVKRYRIDGFNLDWEYPKPGKETDDYSKFISRLNKVLKKGKKDVTTAVMPTHEMLSERGFEQDAVMVMCYDFQPVNSPVDKVQKAMEYWEGLMEKHGVDEPRRKLVMGLPFYGRSLEKWSKAKGYGIILKEMKPNEEVNEIGRYAFDNISKIREKVEWAVDQDYQGVFIWQLAQDAVGKKSLLLHAYQQVMLSKGVPDLNLDGRLSKSDLIRMKKYWGKETDVEKDRMRAWSKGDLNLDGAVDAKDLVEMEKGWPAGVKAVTVLGKAD